jgi:hypothetical protein
VFTTESVARAISTDAPDARRPVELVRRLCQSLADAGIDYCHWKSNNAIDRSATAENDLDLLVNRADATRFTGILSACGFKLAHAPAHKQMTGVVDYFGYDLPADRWVHVHAHYQLVAGHDLTKDYRIPIEKAYLDGSVQGRLFRVPPIELEFIVFIIRMMLKHSTWDAVCGREGRLKASERQELHYLESRVTADRVTEALARHLPSVSIGLFRACIAALRVDSSVWMRVKAGHQLQKALAASAGHSAWSDAATKARRRVAQALRRRLVAAPGSGYRLATGGVTVALVGGDGAGKSTAINGLHAWLSAHFDVCRVHLGRPAWSPPTIALRTVLKVGQLAGLYPLETSVRETVEQASRFSPGYPWLIREVCRARDRYRTYLTARRRGARGGIVLFDRFPLPEIQGMDGPLARQFLRTLGVRAARGRWVPHSEASLARRLVALEERAYERILPPDIVVVLRVEPGTAVRRKPEEDPDVVRERSAEIWNLEWNPSRACVIDAGQSPGRVLSELKALIWSRL